MRRSTLLAIAALCTCVAAQAGAASAAPTKSIAAAAPKGAKELQVTWRSVHSQSLGTILFAEARPAGKGPFPAVVLLHGTHGFAREYVQLAKELSKAGVVAIAACWFAPGQGAGTRFITPLKCPADAPPISAHQSKQAMDTIALLVRAAQALPQVDGKRIAVFGHSRGAGVAWNYALRGGKIQAAILNSSGYPDELIRGASAFKTPVLMLHGEKDGPADGGSSMTDPNRARSFQSALLKSGKPVEAVYYPEGGHNGLFASRPQHDDELRHMIAFLKRHLRIN